MLQGMTPNSVLNLKVHLSNELRGSNQYVNMCRPPTVPEELEIGALPDTRSPLGIWLPAVLQFARKGEVFASPGIGFLPT